MKKSIQISSLGEWQDIKISSKDNSEIIILKISPICTLSFVAEKIFDLWFSRLPENIDIICLKIDVIKNRNLSRSLAQELNIIHQSPQIIWLYKSLEVKWHDSHYRINENSLNSHLSV